MKAPSQVLALLDELGIGHETQTHEAVFTVAESKALRGHDTLGHTKNLFVRNKQGRMWLITLADHKRVDLKALAALLGAGRLSFGSPERLQTHLGVTPGSVTALAVVNDPEGAVTFCLDQDLMQAPQVFVHPLVNTATTRLSPQDLLRFVRHTGHEPQLIAVPEAG